MDEVTKYAEEWDESSKYFYDNKRYDWMAQKVSAYNVIVEIGCGTGYSTLSLVEQGHKVIAIDKNKKCIMKARALIEQRGYADKVVFIVGDIVEQDIQKKLQMDYSFDAVICWNVGTYWSKSMIQFYHPHLLKYGLTTDQIRENPESSYSELILWNACKVASNNNVPIHIIDREKEALNYMNDPYYKVLGKEFLYSEINYDNLECDSLSSKGRMLSTKGIANNSDLIDIVLVSILIK